MSESARKIIIDAMEDLVVLQEEAPLEQPQANRAIRTLNRLMASLASNGINLGFTRITKINDLVTIPDGAIDAVIALLALRLHPKYKTGQPTPTLVMAARDGLKTLHHIAINITGTKYPCTLPQGSGNSQYTYGNTTFYPCEDATILSEQGGSISLEQLTGETYE